MKSLGTLLAVLFTFSAQAFDAYWYLSDFSQDLQGRKEFYVTPLEAYTTSGTNTVTGDRIKRVTTVGGYAVISNMIAGSYRVEIIGSFTKTTFTNYFTNGTSGYVNGKDFVAVSTGAGSGLGYSQAGADARFVNAGGDSMTGNLNLGTNYAIGDGSRMTNVAGAATINVLELGAVRDQVTLRGSVNTVSNSTTITCTNAAWSTNDIGKNAELLFRFRAPITNISCTIVSVNSSTSIVVSVPAIKTVSNAWFQYGTDNTAAFQRAINVAASYKRAEIFIPRGRYFLDGPWLRDTNDGTSFVMLQLPGPVSFSNSISIKFKGEGGSSYNDGDDSGGTVLVVGRSAGTTNRAGSIVRNPDTWNGGLVTWFSPYTVLGQVYATTNTSTVNLGGFTSIRLQFQDINLSTFPYPDYTFCNAGALFRLNYKGVRIDPDCGREPFETINYASGYSIPMPWLTFNQSATFDPQQVAGVIFPYLNNGAGNSAEDTFVIGYWHGYVLSELCTIVNSWAEACSSAYLCLGSPHAIYMPSAFYFACNIGLFGGGQYGSTDGRVRIEGTIASEEPYNIWYDPSNFLYGFVTVNNFKTIPGTVVCPTFYSGGGTNLPIFNIGRSEFCNAPLRFDRTNSWVADYFEHDFGSLGSANSQSWTHGLGRVPDLISVELVCTNNDAGSTMTAGEKIDIYSVANYSAPYIQFSVSSDLTNLWQHTFNTTKAAVAINFKGHGGSEITSFNNFVIRVRYR